jgi:hypothetical protein
LWSTNIPFQQGSIAHWPSQYDLKSIPSPIETSDDASDTHWETREVMV